MTSQEVSVDDLTTMSVEEAEETLRAIRSGHVDAFVTSDGASEQVVTLRSAADARLELILEAGVILRSSLDCEATLASLGQFLVGRLADWCVIDVVDQGAAPGFAVIKHTDPSQLDKVQEVHRRYPPIGETNGHGRALLTGRSGLYPVITDENIVAIARDAKHLKLLREVGMTSALVVAIKVGARVFGAITLIFTTSNRRYAEVDLKIMEKIALHAALAIDNGRLYVAEREARREAERAMRRVERMHTLTSALGARLGITEIGDLIVRESLALLGGQGGVLAMLTPDGQALEIVNTHGYSEELLARWNAPMPISNALPLCEAVRTGKLVKWEDVPDSDRYPIIDEKGGTALVTRLVCAPLLFEQRVLGVLGASFDKCRRFSEEDLANMETLAQQCAQALERARLHEAERKARFDADLLYTLVDTIGRAETLDDVLEPAMTALERALGTERSLVLIVDPDGVTRIKASRGVSKSFCEQIEARAPWSAFGLDARILVGDLTREERLAPLCSLYASEGIQSLVFFPLIHQNQVIGRIGCYANEKRIFSAEAVRLAATVARQVAQAIAKRASEAENARLYAETDAANRMKDEFLAVVSHELRTPLAAIAGWATILSGPRAKDPASVARGIEVIRRNAKAQGILIEDILDVSRIITGKLVVDPRPVSLLAIVGEALETMRASANAKDISVTLPSADDAFIIVGDPDRLRQIAWNLVSNAIKFTPSGGRVDISIERLDGAVALGVADNGRGIAPSFLPHVFERFRQADSSTTRQDSGIGLGLAIVRHLVELHGGQVHVESPGLGKGATFRAVFPVRALFPDAPLERRVAPPPPLSADAHTDLSRVRILLIDDQPDARDLLAELLSSLGAEVEIADSAGEALVAMHRSKPDMLVSDIGMPSEDGYMLIRRVRALPPPLGNVPALALTAYARSEDAEKAIAAGFDRHIAKPTSSQSLASALAELLAPKLGGDVGAAI